MNRITKVLSTKKMKGYNWKQLAEPLPIGAEGLRAAFSRGSVSSEYLDVIEKTLGIKNTEEETKTKTRYQATDATEVSFEDLLLNKIMFKIKNMIDARCDKLEKKQLSIRSDFHDMFERQLRIEKNLKDKVESSSSNVS